MHAQHRKSRVNARIGFLAIDTQTNHDTPGNQGIYTLVAVGVLHHTRVWSGAPSMDGFVDEPLDLQASTEQPPLP